MIKEIAFRELLDSSIVVDFDEVENAYTIVVESQWGWWPTPPATPTKSLLSVVSMNSADWAWMTAIPWDFRYSWYSATSEIFPETFFVRPVWLPQTITSIMINPKIYPPASWRCVWYVSLIKNWFLVKTQLYDIADMYLASPIILDLTFWLETWETNVFAWTDTFLLEISNNFIATTGLDVASIYINGYLS